MQFKRVNLKLNLNLSNQGRYTECSRRDANIQLPFLYLQTSNENLFKKCVEIL